MNILRSIFSESELQAAKEAAAKNTPTLNVVEEAAGKDDKEGTPRQGNRSSSGSNGSGSGGVQILVKTPTVEYPLEIPYITIVLTRLSRIVSIEGMPAVKPPPTLLSKEKREMAAHELITSEYDYVLDLTVLVRLRDDMLKDGVVSESDVAAIFNSIT